ncbi:MAG TPA: alpha/beta hydrolase [Gemmatimonadales bacterium]|jgi:pimeloyl-ACP methyl ester carboxylesterase
MNAEDTASESTREAVLLLPGMTLNGSIFPDVPAPSVAIDFNELRSPPATMRGYAGLLDHHWRATPNWDTRRWIMVGHSFGGMVALQWLVDHPRARDRVRGLVLIATTAGPVRQHALLRLGQIGRHEFRAPVAPFLPLWNSRIVTHGMKWLVAQGATHRVDFRALRRHSDFAVDLAGWRDTRAEAMRGYRSAAADFDLRTEARSLTVPTIVIHGTRDSLFALDAARALAATLPRCELRVVDGAAHALPLTHGAVVEQAISDLRAGSA